MRIIRSLVILRVLLALILTPIALAAETDTNETNINSKINTPIFAFDKSMSLLSTYEIAVEPQKPVAMSKRDMTLARWKAKQSHLWENLPKGQFTINASAYTAAADECGKSDGITASGVKVQEKRTLACPPQFPFGTQIKIDGYGTYVCEDRGGAIKGNHVDIYVETKNEAFAFGRRNLMAEVIL
ncbi:MAG: 3D domain-containing protein [Parcubacteria group bacterium]|jgi:3D (Asp-Asp-Asp) domain-containing protein